MPSATTIANLIVKLTGDVSDFNKKMDGVAGKMDQIGAKMQKAGAVMTAGVTAPLAAAATKATSMALDFDKAMRGVNSVVKLGEREFQQLKTDVLDLSTTTSRSSVEVAEAFKYAASTGLDAASSYEVLEHSLDAASNMGSNANTVIRGVSKTMQAFGMETDETVHILDVLQTAATKSSAEFEPLVQNFAKVGAQAAAMGISFEETVASIMAASDAGYNMAEATTAIARAMQTFLKPTDELQEAIESWGYETGEALIQAEGFQGAIKRLEEEAGGSSARMTELVGNVRGLRGVLALTGEGADAFAESLDEVSHASDGLGEHLKLVEERHQSTAYQMDRLQSYVEIIAIRIGNSFLPVLDDAVRKMKDWAEQLANASDANVRTATTVGLVAAALGPATIALGTFIRSVGSIVSALQIAKPLIVDTAIAMKAFSQGASAAEVASIGAAGKLGLLATGLAAVSSALAGLYAGGKLATPISKLIYGEEGAYRSQGLVDTLTDVFSVLAKINTILASFGLNIIQRIFGDWPMGQKIVGFTADIATKLDRIGEHKGVLNDAFKLDPEVANLINQLSQGQIMDYEAMAGSVESVGAEVITLEEKQRRQAENAQRSIDAQTARWNGLAKAAENFKMTQAEIDAGVNQLSLAISGPVGQANENYLQQVEDINAQMEEEQANLENLQRKNGIYIDTTNQFIQAQADQQKTAERLSKAQEQYNEAVANGSDDVIQYQAKLNSAQSAMEDANKAVAAGPGYYTDYNKAIDESKGKIGELEDALREAAAAHREHIQQIIYDMMQARLAADGWTEAEYNLALATAESMGLIDKATLDASTSVNEALTQWQRGLIDTDEFIATLNGTVEDAIPAVDGLAEANENAGKIAEEAATKMGNLEEGAGKILDSADKATEAVEGMNEGVTKATTAMRNKVLEDVGAVKDDTESSFKSAREAAQAAFNSMQIEIAFLAWKIQDDVATAIGKLPGIVGGYEGDMRSAGSSLMGGLKGGILSRAGEIASAAAQVVRDAIAAARNAAAISSPSKETMEIGIELIRGLIAGIDLTDTEAIRRVEEFVGDIGDAFTQLLDMAHKMWTLGAVGMRGGTPQFSSIEELFDAAVEWLKVMAEKIKPLADPTDPGDFDPADRVKEFVADFNKAFGELVNFADDLNTLINTALPSVDEALSAAETALRGLGDWVVSLGPVLQDMATGMYEVTEETSTALSAAGDATKALDGFMSALLNLGGIIKDVLEFGLDMPKADVGNYLTQEFEDVLRLMVRISFWLDHLYAELGSVLPLIIQNVTDASKEFMDDVSDASNAIDGALGALLDLAEVITDFLNISKDFPKADIGEYLTDEFEHIFRLTVRLAFWIDNLYRELGDVLPLILNNLNDATTAILSDIDEAASALDAFLSSLMRFSETLLELINLGGSGLPALLEIHTGCFGHIVITFSTAFQTVIDFVRHLQQWTWALYTELGKFIGQGLEDLDAETQAAIDRITDAVGSLNSMFDALTGLTSMMADVAFVAGTEFLEEEDWAGLAWALTRTAQVIGTGLSAVIEAVEDIDAASALDAASIVGHIGEALVNVADAFANISVSIPPTEGQIEGFLASLADFWLNLRSYLHLYEEMLETPFEDLSWYDLGANLGQSLIDGLESQMGSLENTLQSMRDLMPSSPAKRGPFSRPPDWSFLAEGLSETMTYIRGQTQLTAATPTAAGNEYNMNFNYPPNTPVDLKQQLDLIKLTERYKS